MNDTPIITDKKDSFQAVLSHEGDLLIPRHLMARYGLRAGTKVTLQLDETEIRILPEHNQSADQLLDALAGCLGQEPVQAYDFDLKLGGYLLKNAW